MVILQHREWKKRYGKGKAMDALDQWIARRTDRGLLYIVLGIIALFILGGVGYELLESMRA